MPAAPKTHVALLRGVNVGGHKQVAMADLRGMLAALGFTDPRTLLQSGNLVFRGGTKTGAPLERWLEAETAKRLRVETRYFVRAAEEWNAVIAQNPFPREAAHDPARLIVMFLDDAPAAGAVRAVQDAITGREVVRARGRHAYIVYPDGMGRSRLTIDVIEKGLGTHATGRNWNTVLKLGALVQA